jgi:hypothetical protein
MISYSFWVLTPTHLLIISISILQITQTDITTTYEAFCFASTFHLWGNQDYKTALSNRIEFALERTCTSIGMNKHWNFLNNGLFWSNVMSCHVMSCHVMSCYFVKIEKHMCLKFKQCCTNTSPNAQLGNKCLERKLWEVFKRKSHVHTLSVD